MKMLSAGTAAANQYTQYVDNCQRAVCALPYTAPLPSVADLQLFVDFGASQPGSLEFTLIDTCNNNTEQIFPAEYIVGQTPELANHPDVVAMIAEAQISIEDAKRELELFLDEK